MKYMAIKFVLTVCICSILYFCKKFADCKNFCESSKWKEQSVFLNICKVK